METIEHFAKISLVARLLGRENLIAREEVDAAAGAARHLRHQGAGADLRRIRRARRRGGDDPATCQVVEAPAGGGLRLVPDLLDAVGDARAEAAGRWRRGNSVNIPRTLRADRRRDSELAVDGLMADG